MWEKKGTVTIAGNTVLGQKTEFLLHCRVGDCFIGPDNLAYEITHIVSNTHLLISPNYRSGTVDDPEKFYVLHTQPYDIPSHDRVLDFVLNMSNIPEIPEWLSPFDREAFKALISDAQGSNTIPIADSSGKLNVDVFGSELLRVVGLIDNNLVHDRVPRDKVLLAQIPVSALNKIKSQFTG